MDKSNGIIEGAMKAAFDAFNGAADWVNEVRSVGSRADDEAERRFPGQERDNSQKNAFRHALGTGRLAQLLGADSDNPVISAVGQGLGQGAGHLWEALSLRQNVNDPGDMRHDLNNNFHGAEQAAQTRGYAELADRLEGMARGARREEAPGAFSPARPYMTYTK